MKQLTIRGIITGVVGLTVITASSMYVALRMGALPWPTVFVTVLSMTVLGRAKDSTLKEINVTHTLMSAGSMVAGGLAFTLPGFFILNPDSEISFFLVLLTTVLGAVLGTLYSSVYREILVEDKKIAFPIGQAAYKTLITGVKSGTKSIKLFVSMALSIVFTFLRDLFAIIPSVAIVYKGSANVPAAYIWVSPMAVAIGSMIDKMSALFWVLGCAVSYLILSPLGASSVFIQNLGIGLMIGTGIGVLFKALFTMEGKAFASSKRSNFIVAVIVVSSALIIALATELTFIQGLIAVVLIGVTCLLSGLLTGQSGVNPMEIFGILVMLAVGFSGKTSALTMFIVASLTSVACGLSGDVMNDFKSGQLVGTNPKAQIIGELIGGVIGAVLSVCVFFIMKTAFGAFGTDVLPAPQAKAVASMASGFGNSIEFFIGIAAGALIFILGLPSATLGLGIYLSSSISLAVGLGAVITEIAKKTKKVNSEDISLVGSGLLGGEGIAGVVIAIFSML